jgi:hypothetical protein
MICCLLSNSCNNSNCNCSSSRFTSSSQESQPADHRNPRNHGRVLQEAIICWLWWSEFLQQQTAGQWWLGFRHQCSNVFKACFWDCWQKKTNVHSFILSEICHGVALLLVLVMRQAVGINTNPATTAGATAAIKWVCVYVLLPPFVCPCNWELELNCKNLSPN